MDKVNLWNELLEGLKYRQTGQRVEVRIVKWKDKCWMTGMKGRFVKSKLFVNKKFKNYVKMIAEGTCWNGCVEEATLK